MPKPAAAAGKRGATGSRNATSILSSLDMTSTVAREQGRREIERNQGRLNLLQRKAQRQGVSTILVFEGWDAAGKGGAIRRVTAALDARRLPGHPHCRADRRRARAALPVAVLASPAAPGRVTIFDRSWYGRVLVERVEGFATEKTWMRAYAEINQFEDQLPITASCFSEVLAAHHQEEQLRRFKEREATPHKQLEADRRGLA